MSPSARTQTSQTAPSQIWPALPLADWRETCDTLHLWMQIVGKVKLALHPFLNQFWQVAFHVTARGMTTGLVPAGDGAFDVTFDFIDHTLTIRTSGGGQKTLALAPRCVADFYAEFMGSLRALGIEVAIDPLPVEIPDPIRCDQDRTHAAYDRDYVHRWWQVLVQTEKVLQQFRADFVGKSSPILFFWGSFDLTTTRFSGRPATPPQGAPAFFQLAENQENAACGFWPGNANAAGFTLGEPAFYAYIYPEPAGFKDAAVKPAAAYYHKDLGEFILPYDAVCRSASPAQDLLAFCRSTYDAAASLAHWDRAALERR
jgi:hypothetical protein